MKRSQRRSALRKVFQISLLDTARVQLSSELVRFMDFIHLHNPNADETVVAMTVATCLRSLPACFSHSPEAMQELNAIVNRHTDAQ